MSARTYFDHAATSFPKPGPVVAAMHDYMQHRAGNPGRGSYPLAQAASQSAVAARRSLARLFDHDDPERVILTPSATHALNLVIQGALSAGDHVVTSSIEHNAVARPLQRQSTCSVDVTKVAAQNGIIDPDHIAAACTPHTKMVVLTAGSNVLGARTELEAVRHAIGEAPLLCIDAAQTAGVRPLHMADAAIDYLAVPGHKGLNGPPGIGALLCSARASLTPLIEGGTGGNSEPKRTPAIFPDGFEAGTANGPGIAGLAAAADHTASCDLPGEFDQKMACWAQLLVGLQAMDEIEILSCTDVDHALPLISFRCRTATPADIGFRLAQEFDIAVRVGLHCAPDAHRTVGSLDTGLVRFSIGKEHRAQDIDYALDAINTIVRG